MLLWLLLACRCCIFVGRPECICCTESLAKRSARTFIWTPHWALQPL
jgi:hypothetical protein